MKLYLFLLQLHYSCVTLVLDVSPKTLSLRWNQPRLNGSKGIEGWEIAVGTNDEGWSNMDPEICNTAVGESYWNPGDRAPPEKMYFNDDEGDHEEDDEEEEEEEDEGGRPTSAYVSKISSVKTVSSSKRSQNNTEEEEEKLKLCWRPLKGRIQVEAKHIFMGDLTKYCVYTFQGFAPTSPYQIRLRAYCTTGNGEWSLPSNIIFTTKEDFDIRAIVWEAKVNGIEALVELMKNPRFIENANLQTRCVRVEKFNIQKMKM